MKALNCCKTMEAELTAWKANVYDIVRRLDELSGGEKDKFHSNIEDLHMFLEEISDRVEKLKTECPSDWSPVKKDIEDGTVNMRGKYEETMEYIGKSSPVSIPG